MALNLKLIENEGVAAQATEEGMDTDQPNRCKTAGVVNIESPFRIRNQRNL